ncbi:hypothetical protein DV515_00000779 [Chloebia gouldiae]|uniref:Uncharacterized protein n=1 Tax=Chloebia gouldiae TaxID=44316 RepID=A0A3L8T8X8_CHLGU|nr:hypothetical protein DV515_00000779 [Chloebia gouldiae]
MLCPTCDILAQQPNLSMVPIPENEMLISKELSKSPPLFLAFDISACFYTINPLSSASQEPLQVLQFPMKEVLFRYEDSN